jgi:hypothetical protein
MAHERNVFVDAEKFHGARPLIVLFSSLGFVQGWCGIGMAIIIPIGCYAFVSPLRAPNRTNGQTLQFFLAAIPPID